MKKHNQQTGFTLIELMIVVAVIGILAMIAYPSYQRHIIKTKRTEMMTELQGRASRLESQKLALGSYSNIATDDYTTSFPNGNANYTVALDLDQNADGKRGDWVFTATPIAGSIMAGDGELTFDVDNQKCRNISGDTASPNFVCGPNWNN